MRNSNLLARIEALEVELARLRAIAPTGSAAGDPVTTPAVVEQVAAPRSSRRDLFRYGAAAFGAAAASLVPRPANAADGGPVVIGSSNTATQTTTLTSTSIALQGVSNNTAGVVGVKSDRTHGYGLFGVTSGTSGAGVFGYCANTQSPAAGVEGVSYSVTGAGVHGIHHSGNAMLAEVPSNSVSQATALYALNYSAYQGSAPGGGGFAVYGLSAKGHGLVGATAAPGAAAVVGATNGVAGAYAAAFYGPTVVSGNFTVVGGAKSAAVPHPDGSHRRLYCVESPESWFEDFGRAALMCGEAVVPLDRDFAAVADVTDYHVFLTGHDGRFDLSVSDQTPEGFRVKAASGVADGTFSWRVVAKRKDIAAPRFDPVIIPTAPTLPPIPASSSGSAPPPPFGRG